MPARPSLSLLLALLLSIPFAFAQARAAESGPVVPYMTRLGLDVRIDYDSGRLAGTATLTLRNPNPTPIARIPLLLNRLMRADGARDGDGRVLALSQDVVVFEDMDKYQVNAVEIELAEPLRAGQSVEIAIDYAGHLVGYAETGMLYVRDHVARDFTILREEAFAFPVVGVPSSRANRAVPREPWHFDVSVTVPEGLVVALGGERMPTVARDGLVTWRYRSREPAQWVNIAVAPYAVAERGDLRVFHFPGDEEGARLVLSAIERAAERFDRIFGPLDKPLALTVAQIPEGWGSQASLASGIILEAPVFRDRSMLDGIYHELSHLWNAPDTEAHGPRWNEGLAMFLQGRMGRELDGLADEAASYDRAAARLVEQCTPDQPCGRVPMRAYGEARMTDYSYRVGRLMFAALHHALGEETFDRALRTHFQAHKASGGGTDDLVRAFVEVGGAPARRIFDDWLDSTAWVEKLREAGSAQALFDDYRD